MRAYNLGFISDELVFGDKTAFYRLCAALPDVVEDVVSDNKELIFRNSVYEELMSLNPDVLKSLYLLAFSTYEGFDTLCQYSG